MNGGGGSGRLRDWQSGTQCGSEWRSQRVAEWDAGQAKRTPRSEPRRYCPLVKLVNRLEIPTSHMKRISRRIQPHRHLRTLVLLPSALVPSPPAQQSCDSHCPISPHHILHHVQASVRYQLHHRLPLASRVSDLSPAPTPTRRQRTKDRERSRRDGRRGGRRWSCCA